MKDNAHEDIVEVGAGDTNKLHTVITQMDQYKAIKANKPNIY